jgi:hypothetical protein
MLSCASGSRQWPTRGRMGPPENRWPCVGMWNSSACIPSSVLGRPSYSYVDGELRKVARDAYMDWQESRYSVTWQ